MKSILITGGSGYLGGRIYDYLKSFNEFNIIVASRKNINNINQRKVDWNSKVSIKNLCNKIDIIIHLAAINAKECLDNPDEAYKVNTLNTKNLIESAILNKVKKVIYFSTAHVYSSCLSGLIDENTKTNNEHPYFDKKNNFQGIILRLSNSFGPPSDINSNCWMLFANDICKSAVLKSKIFIKSNPLQVRDFVTLSDVCRVTKHFLDYKVESNPVFNIGGRSSFTLIDFAKLVQKQFKNVFNEKIEIISNTKNKTKPFLNYNIRKLESTGFVLQSKIEDEIVSLIKFCKKNF